MAVGLKEVRRIRLDKRHKVRIVVKKNNLDPQIY